MLREMPPKVWNGPEKHEIWRDGKIDIKASLNSINMEAIRVEMQLSLFDKK
jgi:hypothetical protein